MWWDSPQLEFNVFLIDPMFCVQSSGPTFSTHSFTSPSRGTLPASGFSTRARRPFAKHIEYSLFMRDGNLLTITHHR
jgi:hypothetical protein